jgi:hypothetical protein
MLLAYPGFDLIKLLFGINLLTLFCNLDHLINAQIIVSVKFKYLSKKSVSKFMPFSWAKASLDLGFNRCQGISSTGRFANSPTQGR